MLEMLSSKFFLPTTNFRYLSVLLAIHNNSDISQHSIAKKVGMSGAMVNSYIKKMKLASHLNVININGRDKKYELTGSGKEVLMEHLMSCSAEIVQLYSKAKSELVKKLVDACEKKSSIKVVLYGGSDTARLVVSAIEQIPQYVVVAIVDNDQSLWGQSIGGHVIQNPALIKDTDFDCIVISTFAKQNEIYASLKTTEEYGTKIIRLSAL